MTNRLIRSALIVVAGIAGAGSTVPASAQLSGPRKVTFVMTEYKYSSSSSTLKVKKGEKVAFTFLNKGKLPHEAMIGTPAAQAAHEKEMASMGGMMMHDTKEAITVKPGKSGSMVYSFDKPGKYEIACHQTGHYKLGMKFVVQVS